jgi:hypothetical protein
MNKNALGRSLFYFLFLSLSLCSQPPQRPPDLDRDKRGKCSSRTHFEEKTCVEKENTRKKTKTSLFLLFFFFFFACVGQREKEECGFLSLSLLLPPITLDVSHALIFARVSKKAGKEIVFGKQEQGGDSPYFFPSVSALLGKPG